MEDKIESSWEKVPGGLVWIGSRALAERLILEKKMKAPPPLHFSSWLKGTMNQTSQYPQRAETPGIYEHSFALPPQSPYFPCNHICRGRERERQARETGPPKQIPWKEIHGHRCLKPLILSMKECHRNAVRQSRSWACLVCISGIRCKIYIWLPRNKMNCHGRESFIEEILYWSLPAWASPL